MAGDARKFAPLLLAILLLIVAASRIARLDGLDLNADEAWSVWQTLGTPAQIAAWTPYDWSPLFYLGVGAWRGLTGLHPLTIRYGMALAFLLGCACTYRAARRLAGERAAVPAMLAYAALGLHVYLSISPRGYALLIALLPLALWLALRYFDRPALRRAVPLAITLAAMFYVNLTSAVAFLALGLLTLAIYRGRALRGWIVPGLLAALIALPEIAAKASLAISRTRATASLVSPPLPDGLARLYADDVGAGWPLWIVLAGLAAFGLLRQRRESAAAAALLLWIVGGPLLMYALNPVLGFFSPRYAWWVMLGLALGIGLGLADLPRAGRIAAGALLLGLMFLPLPLDRYDLLPNPPLSGAFAWLRERARPGDAVVIDPNAGACGATFEWDYNTRAFFPGGLAFSPDPAGYRRVWYVIHDSRQDAVLDAAVREGRVPGEFYGPPDCLWRLFEGPPDAAGIPFENGLRFHGADVLESGQPAPGLIVRHEGEAVRVRLWWSADGPLAADYSVALYLLAPQEAAAGPVNAPVTPGALVRQVDGPPQTPDGPSETSRWQTERYYRDEREIVLPDALAPGTYSLMLIVYQWWDNVRISAPGVDADTRLPLLPVYVAAW